MVGSRRCQHKVLSSSGKCLTLDQPHWSTSTGQFGNQRPSSSRIGISQSLPVLLPGGTPNSWRWTGIGASTLSPTQQQQLTGPFLADDVREAICGLNAEGAPRPDEIPVFFYKDCWALVGPDVMALMEEFHVGTCHMGHINRTYITLLPKVFEAEREGDFCPISLSNNIYLIIAKVLANCFRGLLGPSSVLSSLLLFRGGRCQMVLLLQRRLSLIGEGRAPRDSYGRWILSKHMIPLIIVSSEMFLSDVDFQNYGSSG